MKPLIDADILAYRISASCENEDEAINYWRMDDCIGNIHDALGSMLGAKYFLTGSNNFRKIIDPQYKVNRTAPKPKWLQHCRNYLIKKYNAVICDGYEADDAMGFNQDSSTIICTIDKDLLMIPGKHYNWIRNEFKEVTEYEGMSFFWKQMIIGDRSDNIIGINGLGPVKAERIISACQSEDEMFEAVLELYKDDNRFLRNANCLWIWRKEGELWQDANPSYCSILDLTGEEHDTSKEKEVEPVQHQEADKVQESL